MGLVPSLVAAQEVFRREEERKRREKAKGLTWGRSNPMTEEKMEQLAEAIVEKAMDMEIRDIMIGSAMGKGAIPLYGRETRKELCDCCLIDPVGPNAPENRMCTTKGAIGLLNNREEREWCSEIKIVPDGRCTRAMAIREAAKECKEKHPDDTEAFFSCYIPAFSQITRGSNPGIKEIPIFGIKTNEPSMMAATDELERRGYMKTVPAEPETLEGALKLLTRETTMDENRIITISLMDPAGITKTQARDIQKLTEKLRKEAIETAIRPIQRTNWEALGRFAELVPEIDRLRMAQAEDNLNAEGLARLQELAAKGSNPGTVPEIELYRTTRGFEEDAALRTDLETVQGYKLHAVFETPAAAQSAVAELVGQDIRFVKHISTTGVKTWEVYAKPPAVEVIPKAVLEARA